MLSGAVRQATRWRVGTCSMSRICYFVTIAKIFASLSPAGNPEDYLYAYKFSRDNNGNPLFTLAGKSARTFAGESVPTVTSRSISVFSITLYLPIYRQ
jgi:hypothetical protein